MAGSEDVPNAAPTTPANADPGGPGRTGATVITDARQSTSAEMSSRMKRYAITMAFRTACFISMIFVRGPLLWVLFACAVFLPYIAVILANQANQRAHGGATAMTPTASDAPQLTTGKVEIISGDVIDGNGERVGGGGPSGDPLRDDDERRERVA